MNKHNSFARAVYEGQINGPSGIVSDETGNTVPPVIDVVTLEYPLKYGEEPIVADFHSVRTYEVASKAGTFVGRVIEYRL